MFYGHDVATAFHNVRAFTSDKFASLDPSEAAHASDRLRDTLTSHHDDGAGVTFESRMWIVTARRNHNNSLHS